MKIQWIQIRGVSWPDDGRASTDHSVLEVLNKKILCQTGESVSHLKNPFIMNKMAYHKYNFSRWFGNMSHFKKDNLKETPCTS